VLYIRHSTSIQPLFNVGTGSELRFTTYIFQLPLWGTWFTFKSHIISPTNDTMEIIWISYNASLLEHSLSPPAIMVGLVVLSCILINFVCYIYTHVYIQSDICSYFNFYIKKPWIRNNLKHTQTLLFLYFSLSLFSRIFEYCIVMKCCSTIYCQNFR